MKVQLKDKLKAIKFDGDINKIVDFIKSLDWKVLYVENLIDEERNHGYEQEYSVYYLNEGFEPKDLYVAKNWYVVIDQDGYELTSCAEDYFNDHYKIVED